MNAVMSILLSFISFLSPSLTIFGHTVACKSVQSMGANIQSACNEHIDDLLCQQEVEVIYCFCNYFGVEQAYAANEY